MARDNAVQQHYRDEAEDALYGSPGTEQMSHDWDDFLDMSDQAEAYDWLDRHNISSRKVQDELVGLWDEGADTLDIQDTFDMIGA